MLDAFNQHLPMIPFNNEQTCSFIGPRNAQIISLNNTLF